MKRRASFLWMVFLIMFLPACSNKQSVIVEKETIEEPQQTETEQQETQQTESMYEVENMNTDSTIVVTINNKEFKAQLDDSAAAKEFYEMLPLSVTMTEMNGNEKYYVLPDELTNEDKKVGSIEAGDIMLYSSDYLVLFYDSFQTSYSYTTLGKIDNPQGLKEAVGNGDVTISFQQQTPDLADVHNNPGEFNYETKTVMLNSGYEMPINGLGTYSLLDDECINSVTEALNRGVRLIDTAYMYHNEAQDGEAVRNSGISREEIFVTTKLYPNQFANAEEAIEEALEKLDIEYIDMMLLHHPGDGDVDAYKAMEKAVQEGKIRSIGLSNWYVEELEEFLPQITIMPALVQNEIHPYYQENDVIPYIQGLGIVVQGWYPLGGRGYTAELLGDEVISNIAKEHGKSSAQIILRWNLQKGVVVIPGSSNPDHIQENTELYDFELTEEEMQQMNSLDRNEKHDWY